MKNIQNFNSFLEVNPIPEFLILFESKTKISFQDKQSLKSYILKVLQNNKLNEINLNHIQIKFDDLSYLFSGVEFNGNIDISEWDVSNVLNMEGLFYDSDFIVDISKWNTNMVNNLNYCFKLSKIKSDISRWDVQNVISMKEVFMNSKMDCNLNEWKLSNINNYENAFKNSLFESKLPIWYKPYGKLIFETNNIKIYETKGFILIRGNYGNEIKFDIIQYESFLNDIDEMIKNWKDGKTFEYKGKNKYLDIKIKVYYGITIKQDLNTMNLNLDNLNKIKK